MKLFAISLKQKTIPLYLFAARASDLTKIVRLTHRSRDERLALQRTLDRKRLKEIALYLREPHSLIANNIILNFDEFVSFKPVKDHGIENAGYLTIPDDSPCATILDGQHRLMGFQLADQVDFELSCIGFLNLDETQAADVFTVINTTQKPLSKSLLLDIRHYIGKTEGEEKKATDIAFYLNNNTHCLLHSQIRVAGGEKGVIALDALTRLIMPFIDLGGVLERGVKKPEPIFSHYINTFFKLYKLPINTATISVALSPVFERVIRRGRALEKEPFSEEGIEDILSPVSDFRWEAALLKNREGRTRLIREFLMRLPEGINRELQEWLL
ncbi:MAG: DGQHR domain-containing protein [Acidobacteria bacterium]|nr:DGQHR domain-containing protein [Acidobacteriota bacterium]